MARHPRFMAIFREMARTSSTNHAEIYGDDLYVIHFPASGRYQWCNAAGPITTAEAIKWLSAIAPLPKRGYT